MAQLPRENKTSPFAALVDRLQLPALERELLKRALTHRSYINEHPESFEDNERLEFLGDAVLDLISAAWLFNQFPELSEGELTRMRSSLVCTERLAGFARDLNLGSAMRLGNGEEQAGGRDKDVLLCATFEALIGAIFLCAKIDDVKNLVIPFFTAERAKMPFDLDARDPKSRLQEWSQASKLGIPHYDITSTSGPDHQRIFEIEVSINGNVVGLGNGHNKQMAERAAAKNALRYLENK